MLGVGISGPLLTNGLQVSGLLAEQPRPEAAGLLEEKVFTVAKLQRLENK